MEEEEEKKKKMMIRKKEKKRKVKCSRLKSSIPFKRDLALQKIPHSKQPFNMQPQIEK